jgi:DNA-binding NarL/FixJ family response regulator
MARAVIVEDHALMRDGIAEMLRRADVEVIGAVGEPDEAYELIGQVRPDVAVVDIGLPGESGIELTRRLLRREAGLGVVIYTGTEDAVMLKDALDCGARGFAYKAGGPNSLITAVKAVAAGGHYVAPEARREILARQATAKERVLSSREREVLALVGEGLSGDEIAERLALSEQTVRTHVRNAMRKLDAHTRAHAIVLALRNEEIAL